MLTRNLLWFGLGIAMVIALIQAWPIAAALPFKLSDVASADDLVAEFTAKVDELERGLVTPDSFLSSADKFRRSATQLAIFAQALSQHDEDSRFKVSAKSLRDAAIQLAQSKSYEAAVRDFELLKQAMTEDRPTTVPQELDWEKLARLRTLMELLRERTDLVRKSLRRPKDAATESRHASAMAIIALAVDAHASEPKYSHNPTDWHRFSLEFQHSMTKTAAAIRSRDVPAAIEHFTAAQEACDRCHEKFKR